MMFVSRYVLLCLATLVVAQGPGPGRKRSPNSDYSQMQSRAVDTRVQLDILEGQPRGTVVGSIPTKYGFTYRFNEPPREFVMNSSTGEIRSTMVLDREALKTDRFDLVVLSSQPTYPIEVRILVLDVNDNAPEFPEPSIAVSFSESATAGTKLLLDTATDRDSGNNGVSNNYKIVSGNGENKFRLEVAANPAGDTSYLYLQTTGKLDREAVSFYQLNISAQDGGVPVHYGYLQVNVTILDVNDNPPVFEHSDYSVSLNESSPIGAKVLKVQAVDADEGDNGKIMYYLSDTERRFSVNPDTGIIHTAEYLNCPAQNCLQLKQGKSCPKSCVVTVYARDHGSPQQNGRAYVTVNLLDANDHDPIIKFSYFPSTAAFATVDENAINGSVVAAVSVIDPDDGLNGETVVSIRSGNELNHFRMESAKNFDIIRVNGVLDREHLNKYNLTITAHDKGTPSRTATSFLIIHVNDVNDHEPVFEKSEYLAVLSELAPVGSYVAGITAVDEDTGVNALIYYSIVSGNENQWFEINADTGLVTTRLSLDREKLDTVELKISARDGGPNPKWTYAMLKVSILDENDEVPKFSQTMYNVSLNEDVPENIEIVTLTAVDHDQGTNGSISYSLHQDTVAKYPSTFSIDPSSGQLTLMKKIDRETISKYYIKVNAKDQGSPQQSSSTTVILTISDVNDNNPVFYPKKYFVQISDHVNAGSELVQVHATDLDEGLNSVIYYKIESNDKYFGINESSGQIYLKSFLENHKNSMNLIVSARDGGGKRCLENAAIEILRLSKTVEEFEHPSYLFQLKEDDGLQDVFVEREIGKVQVRNGEAKYYIMSGDPKGTFEIDESTGLIRTKNKLDREQQSTYSLSVVGKVGWSISRSVVNITVLDVNDNRPQFNYDKEDIKVAENAAVGQEIFLVRAKDRDSGINSRISYSLLSENQFHIEENTGVIYLHKPIQGTPGTVINVEVKATDSGEPVLWSKHVLTVIVADVNDHTPIFEHSSYETSLPESVPVNQRFFPVVATDLDFNENARLTYAIEDGNGDGKFGIFPDGFMYVKNQLDREERDYYCLTVSVRDHGIPTRTSTVPLIIHILDENDNRPEFLNTSFTFYVKENERPDTFVGKVFAVDKDVGRNAELTYSLSTKQSDFMIDSKNGFIRTLHPFDREQVVQLTGQDYISLEATVADNGMPRLRDKVRINVYIEDVNDNAPQFQRTPYKVSVSESAPVATQIIRIITTDSDEGLNKNVFYRFQKGNENGNFVIDAATGQITVAKYLDRETISHYELSVIAYDAAVVDSLSSTTTVFVDIIDENDNAPKFVQAESKIVVLENASVNSVLYHFSAIDPDLGINSEILYSIGSGNRRDTFHIDGLTGILSLHKKLDYEETTSYVLNITAYDGGNPRLASTLLFTVAVEDCNDNAPAFPNTAIVRQIRENIPINTPIVTVTAEDPDSNLNGKIMYAVVKQEPAGPNGNFHFEINPKTGVIHTQLPIDRETIDTFRFTVRATDQALPKSNRLSTEKIVTVIVEDVNDNAPVFISMNTAILPVYKGPNTLVTNLQANDLDSGTNGLVTYDMTGGNTDLFYLHRSTGLLNMKKSPSDNKIKYQLSIKATDEAVQSDRKSTDSILTIIALGRKNELIFNGDLTGNVYENEPIGTNILTISAHHPENGRYEIEYYITNITGHGGQKDDRIFDVDPKLGIISTVTVLDREAGSEWYELELYAIVTNGPGSITGFTKVRIEVLDKNDSPPSFNDMQLEFSVSEDVPVGHVVTTVKATDPDTPTRITYSLVGGDIENFSLDADTGVLSLTDSLDREIKSCHKLHIQANDGIQRTEAVLTITVLDTNDNAPTFLEPVYSFDVTENSARGSKVGQISATDEDENINGMVTYAVISDWANDVFSLNPQTGVFTLTGKLDYEEIQHYVFTVQAQDSGRPALSSTVTVYFNVIDANDNQPLFDAASYSAELFENVTIGALVVVVTAHDLDSGDNGRIEYKFSDADQEDFAIDSRNGTIYTKSLLDRETRSQYNLVVIAKDKAKFPQHELSTSVQVTITVKDVNDMRPEFVSANETWVSEDAALNTVVIAIKAIDRDEGRNGYVDYWLAEGEPFALGADGLLRVTGRLDRERRANYTLTVRARDRGEPSRAAETRLLVRVADENDNAPIFGAKQYAAFVPENVTVGTTVLQVFATDEDDGIYGRIRYTIAEGDDNRDFSITEDGGILRVAKNLDYERRNRYVLTVRAEDCEGDVDLPLRADVSVVTVSVSDVNDNAPVFADSPYYAYVTEEAIPYPGGYVRTVHATDVDANRLRYFIKEGDAELFRINATSGEIYLIRPLDREKQAEYALTVVAMDSGSPPLTGSGIVNVVVQDVNDHSPQFERTEYAAFVSENLPSGSDIIRIQAVDKDAGLNSKIRYSLLGGGTDRFEVNAETGAVCTRVPLDREEMAAYRLTVVAQDGSVTEPKAATVALTIRVLDENDNAPTFAAERYTVYVPDRIQPDQFVFGAVAVDLDSGENSRITYSIMGLDADKFSLDEKTGVIKVQEELRLDERGTSSQYMIQIQASDNGSPSRKSHVDIIVKLWPAHLFPYISKPADDVFVLSEKSPTGKIITKIKASSPKPGAVIKYSVAGGNLGEAFGVDANTGDVMIMNALDYELTTQYEIWIEAEDSDVTPLRSVIRLLINVTDENDNVPEFENSSYTAFVMEEEYPPVVVTKLKASDKDAGANGKVNYKLRSNENGRFTIDGKTGVVKTSVKLDREDVSNYQLIAEAYDDGIPSLRSTTFIYVNVLDKNDNPPRFTRLFSVNVTENAEPGSFVIRITSSDQDIGENANASYSFTENPGNKFAIDSSSGNVTVIGPLDREMQDEYLLKVIALDGSWRAETPLTITVQDQNDNAPEFEDSFYSFYIPETIQPVIFVGQIVAQDRDKQGPNSLITYSFKQPSDYFSIDPTTGELFSKKKLVYKSSIVEPSPENQYLLTVVAADNGKPPLTTECQLTINIINANNNAPTFEQNEYFSPVPSTAHIGQRITHVKATDADTGINAKLEYLKIDGNGSEWFSVDKTDGWVTVAKSLKGIRTLTKFVVHIQAKDNGIPSKNSRCMVILIICGENNHPPVFSALSYQVIVPENQPVGSIILTVAASDEDEGPNGIVRYYTNKTDDNKFSINPITGVITILEPLDFDELNEYKLNILAVDLGFEPKKATATLTVLLTDINDNPPLFNQSSYEVYLSEKMPVNSVVCQIKATDKDSPKNAIIVYSIAANSIFKIDSKTAIVYSMQNFDFEEKTEYSFEIIASNPDSSMFGSTKVFVHVTGENEYFPRFVQPVFHFDVSESAAVGTNVGTVKATDQDAGDDGKIYYLLIGSSNDKGFTINSESGLLSVSRHLDRETQNRVVLTVMAKNAGSIRGNDTDESQVIVSIQDGNDPPEFLDDLYEAEISEAVAVGTRVTTVKAFDKDVKPLHNQFGYSILSGNAGKAFKIDSQSGEIETFMKLDRETFAVYNLIVAAIDTGMPPETGTTTVKISVTDVNDNGPFLEQSSLVGYVNENEPPNTSVMTLNAKDPDLPPNGAPFTYSLIGGTNKNLFSLDSQTGVMKTAQSIDRETTSQIELLVSIEDNGEPRMKSIHTIQIIIRDENDSPSTARSVHVLVHAFNDRFPVGRIADVHPNDLDQVGDYKCRLINDPMPRGILTIPINCELHASKVLHGAGYMLSVLGSDGKHADVVSTITLEFTNFRNETVENSLIVRVENITAAKFLSRYYKGFSDLLKNMLSAGETPYIFSLYDNEDGLEIALAVKFDDGYRSVDSIKQKLMKKLSNIRQLFQSSITIGYTPCKNGTCEHNGICKEEMVVVPDTKITDSQTLIFTSPLVKHDFTCFCQDGYLGKKCEKRQDPCLPNPCAADATCKRVDTDFQCICPPKRYGSLCETVKSDRCDENPCQNGGTCKESPDGSNYFCLCRPGYRGIQCEIATDACRPNPCQNGGVCTSAKPGYKCNCPEGLRGRHCEKSTYGFGELSYAAFTSLDSTTNDISVTFATTKPDALLAYNYGAQTGGRSDFVAVELVDGRAVFAYGGARTVITSVTVPIGNSASLADGNWHKITATRNGRVVSLSVALCTENGDSCEECRPGDASCYADDTGPFGTLNFNGNLLFIGGISSSDALLERPGQVHSDDFVGCIHSVSINGRPLNLSNPIKSLDVDFTCNRSSQGLCRVSGDNSENACGNNGNCYDQWKRISCVCDDTGNVSPNCDTAFEPITLLDGAYVEFAISEKHRRLHLLESIYGGSTLWHTQSDSRLTRDDRISVPKFLSFSFRTIRNNGMLIYMATNTDFTTIEMINGQLLYRSRMGKIVPVNMSMETNGILSDGQWHSIRLNVNQRVLRIFLDGEKVGEELDSESVHNFLDPYLTVISLGGMKKESAVGIDISYNAFSGCMGNFSINGEIQPFTGGGSIFSEVFHSGKITPGCTGPVISGAVSNPDPLRIGVSLVIIFFMTLLIAIIISFVVFRVRRQKKEKCGKSGAIANAGVIGAGDVIRTHSDPAPPYMTDNGDLMRTVTGHHMAPELISKRYKEQEMTAMEQMQRSQRPDIIEREVIGKSPPPREEHPPLHPHHQHESSQSHGDNDLPEHYDLENSSSIAPSDIDIICHYKSYRDGGNIRKYKAMPPHLPPSAAPMYHKHNIQHRHSPLHSSGYTVHSRESPRTAVRPPPPVSRVDSPKQINLQHQSTPLARLSPSSELSQQMPRILTLQDISGKPLQSALLATTSSSGGVGKDAMRTNSERSLNSPVMSQLSGSSESRKPPADGEDVLGLLSPSRANLITLDVVSCTRPDGNAALMRRDDNRSSTSSDESGNDSFTCSEIEYDNNSMSGGDKLTGVLLNNLADDDRNRRNGGSPKLPPYFNASFRGSLSTLVASDEDGRMAMYRTPRDSPAPPNRGWDYLLNWGPNFENFAGVFKDIAELPDSVNMHGSLRSQKNGHKSSEEYV